MDLTLEALALYRKTVLRRQEQLLSERLNLQEQAWVAARRAADLLREKFRLTRIVAFGSLVHPGCFTRWSDIDLAAWGIAPEDTLRAIGVVMDLETPYEINLVDIQTARPAILKVIEREGIEI